MGFVINHAPASIAMSLASQAGRGERTMREAQLDEMNFRRQMALQDAARRDEAFAISSSLDRRRLDMDDMRYRDQMARQQFDDNLALKRFGLDERKFGYSQQSDELARQDALARMAEDKRQFNEKTQFERDRLRVAEAYNTGRIAQGQDRNDIARDKLAAEVNYWGDLIGARQRGLDIAQQNADTNRARQQGYQGDSQQRQLASLTGSLARMHGKDAFGRAYALPGNEEAIRVLKERIADLVTSAYGDGSQPGPGPAPTDYQPGAPGAPTGPVRQPMAPSSAAAPPAPAPAQPQTPPAPFQKGEILNVQGRTPIVVTGVVHTSKPVNPQDGDTIIAPNGQAFIWDAKSQLAIPVQ